MNVVRHVLVRGQVQGVGYRYFVQTAALDGGLEGWVRNRRDGSVEAVLAGPPATVMRVVDACRRGPPGARVDAVDEREASSAEMGLRRPGERFSVASTA